mgnify:CR=1 FL=1
MSSIVSSKQQIRLAIIDFRDICEAKKRNGLIPIAIADEIKESLSKEQIEWLVYHLIRK